MIFFGVSINVEFCSKRQVALSSLLAQNLNLLLNWYIRMDPEAMKL
jgi:hypothetical protein